MEFSLDDSERDQLKNWIAKHKNDTKCPHSIPNGDVFGPKTGAIGGQFTYLFTPTSLGTVKKVKCTCGEEYDCTDYNW